MKLFIIILSLLNIASAVSILPHHWPLDLLNITLIILALLYLVLAYGYLRKKTWAWYGTFFQIALSLVVANTSLTFILTFLKTTENTLNILNGSFMVLELVKGAAFFHPAFKKYFQLDNSNPKVKKIYRTSLITSLIVLMLLTISILLSSLIRFYEI